MKPSRFFTTVFFRALPLLAFICTVLPASAQDHPFYLRKDDRVVFYGDSITQQGLYSGFIETYVLTHFPELNVCFINSGWNGDWVVGGGGGNIDQRLDRDVIAEKPTVATFMLGMNDAAYQDFDQSFFDVYSKGYQHLVDSLRQTLPSLRIILLQPSPFDDVTRPAQYALRDGGYNKVIVRYGQFVQELGQHQNLGVIDMNVPLVAVLEKAHLTDPTLAEKIIPDRIHPAAAGASVMAAAILKAWNAPAVVSVVEINASHGRVERRENTQVTDLQKKPNLSWTQQDNVLPLPLDPTDYVLALVLRSSNIVESLDQQLLKITRLSAQKYILKIDGEKVGAWTREELLHGINLALLPTPMLKQALSVYAFSLRRNSIRLARWQGVQVALQEETSPHVGEALAAIDALDNELLQQERDAAAPKAHRYELVPQSGN